LREPPPSKIPKPPSSCGSRVNTIAILAEVKNVGIEERWIQAIDDYQCPVGFAVLSFRLDAALQYFLQVRV